MIGMSENKHKTGRKLHKFHVATVAVVAAVLVAGGSAFLPKNVDNVNSTVTADAAVTDKSDGYSPAANPRYSDTSWQHIPGIDISASYIQDWDALEKSGCKFVMIRIGTTYYNDEGRKGIGAKGYYEGGIVWREFDKPTAAIDSQTFKNFVAAAHKHNIKVGAYYFSAATTKKEADAEIALVHKIINGTSFDLPLFLDYEVEGKYIWTSTIKNDEGHIIKTGKPNDWSSGSAKSRYMTDILNYWLTQAQNKGYKVGLYTVAGACLYGTADNGYTYGGYPKGGYIDIPYIVNNVHKDICYWDACATAGTTGNTPTSYFYNRLNIQQYVGNIYPSNCWVEGTNYKVDLDMAFVKRPGNVTGLSKTSGQAVFTWKAVTGAKKYQVTLQPKGDKATVTTTTGTAYSYNPASFPNGGTISVKALTADAYGFEAESYSAATASIPARITLTSNNITLSASSFVFNGKDQKPTVTVKYGNTTLSLGKDYLVSYPTDKKSVGTKTITVTGNGEYAGTATATYTIKSAGKDISKLTFSIGTVYDYTGSAIFPTLTVKDGSTKLTVNTDYTVTYSNNTAVGTATATIKGKGKYTGSKVLSYTIKGGDIYTSTITLDVNQYYTGSRIRPSVTITDGNTTLRRGTDYTLEYGENIKIGARAGTIKITGLGKYAGTSTTRTFNILPVVSSFKLSNDEAGLVTITELKTSLNDSSTQYNSSDIRATCGVDIQYADNANFRNAVSESFGPNQYRKMFRNNSLFTKGKTIYVRIKAWETINDRKYGTWVTKQITLTK